MFWCNGFYRLKGKAEEELRIYNWPCRDTVLDFRLNNAFYTQRKR